MSADDYLNPDQFTAGYNYDRKRLAEDIQGVEAFGARRWQESQIIRNHRQRQVQRYGHGYRRVQDTRRQVNVINRALDQGLIEDWGGQIDEDTGDLVAISDFTKGGRSLREFEALPEVYAEATDALIEQHRRRRPK